VGLWTVSSCLRIGKGGGHLWMRWWTFGFHSWVAENRLASQEGFCCMEQVSTHTPLEFEHVSIYLDHLQDVSPPAASKQVPGWALQHVWKLRATEKSPAPLSIQTLGPSLRSAGTLRTNLPRFQFL
jgi:hypothetical protein